MSETGARCEKSYWKSSHSLAKQHCSCDEIGHPTRNILNLSQLFRHFHGFTGAPNLHGTHDPVTRDPTAAVPVLHRQALQVRLAVVAPDPVRCRGRKELSDRQADQTWKWVELIGTKNCWKNARNQ